MSRAVHLELAAAGDVGIPLGRGRAGVTEEVLNDFQISPAFEEVRCRCVVEQVRPRNLSELLKYDDLVLREVVPGDKVPPTVVAILVPRP